MRFGLLGPLTVWTDRGAAVTIAGAKVRALLADLLVHAGEPLSADRLIEDLWDGDAPAKAVGALHSKVSQLRRALGQAEPAGRDLVASTPAGYVLRVDAEAIDAERFATLVAAARGRAEPAAVAAGLSEALALWRGRALADHADSPFALPFARRLEEQRAAALEDLLDARLALGEHASLVGDLDQLVRRYPRRERLRGAHMRALYRAGRQADALASYEQLRVRLVEDLGLTPGHDLARLQQAILVQDPGLDAPAGGCPRTNLPAPLSRLVGRNAAVADVVDRLAAGRLVTLTGPGGVGKTSLALAAATRLAQAAAGYPDHAGNHLPSDHPAHDTTAGLPDRADGARAGGGIEAAWLVELAGWEPPDGHERGGHERGGHGGDRGSGADGGGGERGGDGRLAEHVAGVLGIPDVAVGHPAPGRSAGVVRRLARALSDRALLLVLDNCEHVVGPVAALARALLEAAPGLRVLATSREPLGVPGELVWPVPPLDLPDGDAPELLARSSAVQLFVERAAAQSPGFALDRDIGAAVATICRRLDGLPLALELAAARVRGLGVHALAERLDDRFGLLAVGKGWTPARHRTLRAVIDWSWDLLDPAEQAVLRRAAVHADGFTLDAADAVGVGPGVAAAEVAALLARLVDRSLVVADHTPAGVRYRLLETIAEYATERLDEAGETEATRRRHAHHHVELAEQADARLRGHDQRRWLDRLDAEAANMRLARDWAVEQGEAALALRLAGALSWYWYLRGRHREGYRSLGDALAVEGEAPAAGRALATVWRSALGMLLVLDTERAASWPSILRLYDGVDDAPGCARARWLLALVLFETDESSAAGPLAEQALDGFRRAGDDWGTAAAFNVLGWAALARGELGEAQRVGEQSLALFRGLGDRWGRVRSDDLLGVLAEAAGDLDRARSLHRDGLRLAEELGLWPAVADHLGRLGRLATLQRDFATADVLNRRALRLAHDLAFEHGVEFAHIGLGLSARRQGRLDEAERHLQTGADAHRADGFLPGLAFALAELGFVAELRGDGALAGARHIEGLAAARASGDPRSVALAFEGLAGAAAVAGDAPGAEAAARLVGAASAVRAFVGAPLPPVERSDVDRIAAAARAVLGDAGFDAAFRRGEKEGLDAEP
jgi:predicted ATPase/DNA-binding SARP family transcriptional activator